MSSIIQIWAMAKQEKKERSNRIFHENYFNVLWSWLANTAKQQHGIKNFAVTNSMHFQLFFLCTHTHTHSYSRQYLFRFDGFLGKQNCNQHPFIDLSDKINMNFRSELFLSSSFFTANQLIRVNCLFLMVQNLCHRAYQLIFLSKINISNILHFVSI